MRQYVLDVETNALRNYDKLWVAVFRNVKTKDVTVFRNVHEDVNPMRQFIADEVDELIGHYFLTFDLQVLYHFGILDRNHTKKITDTLVISRLLNFEQEGGHSLEAYGKHYGVEKNLFDDFSRYSQELEDRCITDTEINLWVYNKFLPWIKSPRWQGPIELEHFTALLCHTIHTNGFTYSIPKGLSLSYLVNNTLENYLREFTKDFKPKVKYLRTINPVHTKAGGLHSKDFRWLEGEVKDLTPYSANAPFSLFEYAEFNPNSNIHRIDVLSEAGWKPVNKTKGHQQAIRDKDKDKLKHYAKYGWTIDEENLATLPPDAPESARKLAEYLLYSSRLSMLTQWNGLVDPVSGRINGNFMPIGAWSHRVSHQNPNMANIPALRNRKGQVQPLGAEFRELWTVPEGYKLVGTDAEGIQLRIFAHLCEDPRLIDAIEKGKKEEKTDIHTLNKSIIGTICNSRESAKTAIYALLLGAGVAKLAAIFGCTRHEAEVAMSRLLEFYPGWKKLMNNRLKKEGEQGFIEALDGRYLLLPEPRLALTGHLQSGEKIIMAKAASIWTKELASVNDWMLVNWVHDEWQTEVIDKSDLPTLVGQTQVRAITQAGEFYKMNIRLAGDFKIGNNWKETH